MQFARLVDFEVVTREIADEFASFVGDDRVNFHKTYVCLERRGRLLRGRGTLRVADRAQKRRDDNGENYRKHATHGRQNLL